MRLGVRLEIAARLGKIGREDTIDAASLFCRLRS
jgi:hypothetical protein